MVRGRRVVEVARRVTSRALEWVLPTECIVCGEYGSWWCRVCIDQVALDGPESCIQCGLRSRQGATCVFCCKQGYPLAGCLSGAAFGGGSMVREAIHTCKYQGVHHLADGFGALLAETFWRAGFDEWWWYAVAVPLFIRRERMRGFNQARLIADAFGSRTGVEVLDVLVRTRATDAQAELGGDERRLNLQKSFALKDGAVVAGKNIVLIDDVATTGSTLAECAAVLKAAGAAKVWGLVVARG